MSTIVGAPISALAPAETIEGADEVPVVQGGQTRRARADALAPVRSVAGRAGDVALVVSDIAGLQQTLDGLATPTPPPDGPSVLTIDLTAGDVTLTAEQLADVAAINWTSTYTGGQRNVYLPAGERVLSLFGDAANPNVSLDGISAFNPVWFRVGTGVAKFINNGGGVVFLDGSPNGIRVQSNFYRALVHLDDGPRSYAGAANKWLRVRPTERSFVFDDVEVADVAGLEPRLADLENAVNILQTADPPAGLTVDDVQALIAQALGAISGSGGGEILNVSVAGGNATLSGAQWADYDTFNVQGATVANRYVLIPAGSVGARVFVADRAGTQAIWVSVAGPSFASTRIRLARGGFAVVYADGSTRLRVLAAGGNSFLGLTDMPAAYGAPKSILRVNGTQDGGAWFAPSAPVTALIEAADQAAARAAIGAAASGSGIPDAPSDGAAYVRRNAAWTSGDARFAALSHGHAIADTTGLQAALDAKAPLASPTFTGTPAAPTAAANTNTTQLATTAFVQAAIAALVASSPAALDTLNELAQALGSDPNFATTVTNALAGKQPLDATLTALAALAWSSGAQVPVFTGADIAELRAIGAGAASSLLDRAAGDARYQLADAELAALAGLVGAADRVPYFTGPGAAALATFTAAARTLVAAADAAAQRSALGLGRFSWSVGSLNGAFTSSQDICGFILRESVQFPANFGSSSVLVRVAVNPATTQTFSVRRNNSEIGTIAIASNGAVTLATNGGAAQDYAGGTDVFNLVVPGSADSAMRVMFTFAPTRTG